MKNKTKKILAGACLGLVGMGLMTGCSMTDEQQKALNDIVGKSDQIVELLDKQSKNLSAEEALRLYEFSRARLLVNKDNVWSNLRMIIHQESNEEDCYGTVDGEQHFYTFADGKRVYYGKFQGDTDDDFEIDGYFGEVVPSVQTGISTMSTMTYSAGAGAYTTALISELDIKQEDIVDCKILENGNYNITASLIEIADDIEYPCLVDIELTVDGYLVYYNTLHVVNNNPQGIGYDKYILSTTVKYEYGTLTEAEVQANIDAYIAQEAENN